MEEYRNSQEYIDAFAQYIKSGDDEEIRALLTENVSGTVPVPEFVYDVVKTAWTKDGIMNLVRKSYLKGNLKVGYEIASSGAVIHQEGGDPIDEEQLTLGIVHLIPRNIKKYIAISDELYDLSSRDFLTYVYSELTYQIAKKCGETLIERIVSLSTQSNVPVVDYIDSAITTSTVAMALSKLSDEAVNPVVVMNKGSWGFFKKEQYDNKFGVDVFEGLPVVFNNALKPYNEATTGETFAIVGDFGNGALANYPNGEEVLLKTDELTLAQQDLIKIIGRQYVAVDVVAPKHFAVVNKGDEVTPIVPTGNIEITENGENINVAPYATATVNVPQGGETLHLVGSDENLTMELDEGSYVAFSENFTADDYIAYHGLPLVITINGTEYEAEPDTQGDYECGSFIVGFDPNGGVFILSETDNSPISIKIESYVEMFVNTIRNEYEPAYGSAFIIYFTTFANGRLTTQTITALNHEEKIATPAVNGISKVLLYISIARPANDYYFVPTGDSVDINVSNNVITFSGSGNKVTVANGLD